MFTAIVDPDTAAFRAIRNALSTSLAAHLLYGPAAIAADGGASAAVQALLGRVGAGALAADVASLAGQLASIAAVNEAVHAQLLPALAAAAGDSSSA